MAQTNYVSVRYVHCVYSHLSHLDMYCKKFHAGRYNATYHKVTYTLDMYTLEMYVKYQYINIVWKISHMVLFESAIELDSQHKNSYCIHVYFMERGVCSGNSGGREHTFYHPHF